MVIISKLPCKLWQNGNQAINDYFIFDHLYYGIESNYMQTPKKQKGLNVLQPLVSFVLPELDLNQ
jgi:hypothetical protein